MTRWGRITVAGAVLAGAFLVGAFLRDSVERTPTPISLPPVSTPMQVAPPLLTSTPAGDAARVTPRGESADADVRLIDVTVDVPQPEADVPVVTAAPPETE